MSEILSLRLYPEELDKLECLKSETGLSNHGVISKALDHYLTQVLHSEGFDVICDFKDSVDGINTCAVQTFIEEVNEFTCFKTAFYLDGDKIAFNFKDE